METKHTPGPWHCEGRNVWRENGLDMDQPNLATTHGPLAEANARRIVECVSACEGLVDPSAVPELLEALQMFNEVDQFNGWHPNYSDAIAKARAAIAKATGKTI